MPIYGKNSSTLQLTKDRILIFLLFLFAAVKKTENVFKETKKYEPENSTDFSYS